VHQGDFEVIRTKGGSEIWLPTHCRACGKPLDQAPTGRSRKFCSDTCRKRGQRAREAAARAEALGKAEAEVLAVWNDDALRRRWFVATAKYQTLLTNIAAGMKWSLPAELRGSSEFAIEEIDGQHIRRSYRSAPVVTTIMWDAIAELIYDRDDDEITERMVKGRVKARLIDAIRHSDEFVLHRVTQEVTQADGTTKPVTKRVWFRRSFLSRNAAEGLGGEESWADSGAPSVDGEAVEIADRTVAVRTLEGDEQIAYFALVLCHQSPGMLGEMLAAPETMPWCLAHIDVLTAAYHWSQAIRSDDPQRPATDGLGELIGFFYPTGRFHSGDEVRALIDAALERVSRLTGESPEEIERAIEQGPRDELEDLLRPPGRRA
jgi:predicted nucleic acid-binding Zn ribbon protein